MRNCGRVIMMNFSVGRERELRERYSNDDLKKLKCYKCNGLDDSKGHFNCHEYSKMIPVIYEQTRT
jgi:hypothetical protein